MRQTVALPVRIDVKDVYDETCTELLVTAALDSGGRGRPRVTYDVTAALNAMGAHPAPLPCRLARGPLQPPSGSRAAACTSQSGHFSKPLFAALVKAPHGGQTLSGSGRAAGCAVCTVCTGLCVFMADVYTEAPRAAEAGAPPGGERPQELHRFLVHCPDGRRLESAAEKRCARACPVGCGLPPPPPPPGCWVPGVAAASAAAHKISSSAQEHALSWSWWTVRASRFAAGLRWCHPD